MAIRKETTEAVQKGLEPILKYQAEEDQAQQEVEKLKAAITKKQAEIDAATSSSGSILPELKERLEDLLADNAMGIDNQVSLENIKNLISQEEKTQAESRQQAAFITGSNQPVIAGLQRKLADAQHTLDTLKAQKNRIICTCFRSMAEGIGAEYLTAAQKVIDLHRQLLGVDILLQNRGDRGISKGYPTTLNIPAFVLEATADADDPYYRTLRGCAENNSGHTYSRGVAISIENNLKNQGVRL